MILADINGDGNLDLISANSGSDTLTVWLGNGDGTFRDRTDYPVGSAPFAVVAADLDNQGRLDLICADRGGAGTPGMLTVLMQNADGTFQPPLDLMVGASPVDVAVADVNGDGLPDLISANLNGTLSVLLAERRRRL